VSDGSARAVLSIGAPLALAAAVLVAVALSLTPFHHPASLPVPWEALAVLFAAAQCSVLNIQVKREARSMSLTDAPFVLGLLLVSPAGFIAARVLGGLVAQAVVRRQYRQPLKLAFNVVACTVEAGLGVVVLCLLDGGAGAHQPRAWVAAVAGAVAANVASAVAVSLLISRLEGRYSVGTMSRVAATAVVQAAAIASAGLVGALALLANPWALVPFAVLWTTIVLGYRGYARLSERHQSLERLYRFSQVVSAHSDSELILRGMLEQVCELLVADGADLTFFAGDDHRPDAEASLRRGHPLERRPPRNLTADSGWILDRICREEQPLMFERGTRDLAARHWLDAAGIDEAMIVPLRGENGVIAALTVTDRLGAIRGFDSGDLQLLQTVANHASIALRHGQLMDRLRHDSLHDTLTGIPNRSYLQHEVERLLADLAAGGAPFAVAMLDLDSFKEVNDTLGHQHGDALLCEVAGRLSAAVAGRGLVTRFGGDEFAILFPNCRSDDTAARLCRTVLEFLMTPVDIDGTAIDIGASMGVARAPDHAETCDELIKRADVAMYVAKQAGREVAVFDEAHDTSSPTRLVMVAALRRAINEGALEIHVQPQMQLGTQEVVMVEALARWTDPERGAIPPDEFIPLAERSGLIRPLTDVVLEKAIAACAEWQQHSPGVAVAVNLSARSLHDEGLDGQIERILRRHKLSPRLLTLEITESSVMADPASTLGLLHRLRLQGVRLSIDDFGTGYSSLSYLRRLPVQEVKVDRSFVQRMHQEADDAAIVRSIVELARTLDLAVVAEGVENEQVWNLLRDMRCDVAQGYYLARPMPVAEFAGWHRAVRAGGHHQRLVAVEP
jgi:diguanylate cyclase (GGDEF)-like protein